MDSITSTRIQQNIKFGLNLVATHATVVVLVLLDILVVTVLLIIDLCLPEDCKFTDQCTNGTAHGSRHESMRQAQFVISIIQLIVLSAFILEIIIRVLANIPGIIHDRWQVFDCFIVLVSFLLYICLTVGVRRQTAAYSTAYVISLRLWRIGRIYSVIQQKAAKHAESMMHIHVRTSTAYEEQLKKAQHKITSQKRQMERLEEAVLCLKSVVYSNLTLSANRTRSLPSFTQGHTDLSSIAVQEQSLTGTPQFSTQSDNLLHVSGSAASELAATPSSCRQCLGSLDVPDILDNMKQEIEGQGSRTMLGLGNGCLHRHANLNIAPCLNLKRRQSEANSCSSVHVVADFNNKISINNFDQDPQILAMESYLQSLLNADVNCSYLNEGYIGEEEFNRYASTSVLTKVQSRCDNVTTASVMPNVLSQMCTHGDIQTIEHLSHLPFPYDHTRSYLSQDGIPMTDL